MDILTIDQARKKYGIKTEKYPTLSDGNTNVFLGYSGLGDNWIIRAEYHNDKGLNIFQINQSENKKNININLDKKMMKNLKDFLNTLNLDDCVDCNNWSNNPGVCTASGYERKKNKCDSR